MGETEVPDDTRYPFSADVERCCYFDHPLTFYSMQQCCINESEIEKNY